MPSRAKRFYLCNLIPLWEIDEKDMAVDWPTYHAYFGDLIEMRADIQKRRIRFAEADGVTPAADLKLRFEIYESDFLLSGGRNDHMATFSSHADYGDEPTVRPVKLVPDVDKIAVADQEQFIFIQWIDAHETTLTITASDGTTSSRTEQVPDTLRVRCWWRVTEEDGGDVSGNPEYYYDVYVDGKLENGDDLSLHERSDHELEGFAWNITDKKRSGRLEPLVDGEYAYLKMLQLLDSAQHTIHILNWKMDPMASLVLAHEFQADYLQLAGFNPVLFDGLLVRNKPRVLGVAARDGLFYYTASNGNLVGGRADGSAIVTAVQQFDDPTNLDLPSAVEILPNTGGLAALVLDQLRSRLLLFLTVKRTDLVPIAAEQGIYAAVLGGVRAWPFYQVQPTLPAVMNDPTLIAGLIPLVGEGNPGLPDGGLAALTDAQNNPTGFVTPVGKLNRPTAFTLHDKKIFITEQHRIRRVLAFDPLDLDSSLATGSLKLETLAGGTVAGYVDGAGSAARFDQPAGIVWDATSSRLLVADTGNHKVRAVTLAGAVTTLAISQIDGVAGALGEVYGIAFNATLGSKGTLYLSERDRHRILAVDLATLAATTLAGSTSGAAGFQPGPVAAAAARFHQPLGLAFADNHLFVADAENRVLRVIELATGTVRVIGSPTPANEHVPVALADVLRRKAAEGVKVRILLDDYGSGFARDQPTPTRAVSISGKQAIDDLRFLQPNIQAFVQNHVQYLAGRSLASYHEKMMVVDGKWGVAGGIDFDDDKNDGLLHDRNHRNSVFWHDVAVFVEGKAALGLEEAFVRRWGMTREELSKENNSALLPDVIQPIDRTDPALQDVEAETVRTFDPTPLVGFFVNLRNDAVTEVLQSYRRAILAARYYIYMEHQYLYYPEIGDYLETAMKDNKDLNVIWTLPFFTEETRDPSQEHADLLLGGQLATSITDASQLLANNQLRSQLAWHGFFRQHEMVEKLRRVDRTRFSAFSLRRIVPRQPPAETTSEMIYPHSKIILCDDRFFSIGSANANGRGFTKDGELNVSALAPGAAKALRERLWGEHLGYGGVALTQPDGSLFLTNGHHLTPGASIRLRHPVLGDVVREVDLVVPATGIIFLKGAALPPTLGRVLWSDPTFADIPLGQVLDIWRRSSHSLNTFQKVQGNHATTNSNGELVVNGHLAAVGDRVLFGQRLMLLKDDGTARNSNPLPRALIGSALPVTGITSNTIQVGTGSTSHPDTGVVRTMAVGEIANVEPFRVKLTARANGRATLQLLGLMPNLQDVPFDYHLSWLQRQQGGKKWVRSWEIETPEGIKYAGPGSWLFSPWFPFVLFPLTGIPWLFIDVDPDEQAKLTLGGDDTRLA